MSLHTRTRILPKKINRKKDLYKELKLSTQGTLVEMKTTQRKLKNAARKVAVEFKTQLAVELGCKFDGSTSWPVLCRQFETMSEV
jgi:hypothetical protein